MNIEDWVVIYYDDEKNILDVVELNEMLLEEAESLAEDDQPEEAESYEIVRYEDYMLDNESDLNDDDYEDEEDEDEE